MSALEAEVRAQEAAIAESIEEIFTVGAEVEQTQARLDGSRERMAEISAQAARLGTKLGNQEDALEDARLRYERRAEAAYRGQDADNRVSLLENVFGGEGKIDSSHVAAMKILMSGREDIEAFQRNSEALRSTV